MSEDVVGEIIEANRERLRIPQSGIPVSDPRVDRIIEANQERLRIPPGGIRTGH